MACKTESQFDRLTKVMASGVSRRQVFKYVGATVVGAALVTLGVPKAYADRFCGDTQCPSCPSGVTCRTHPNGTFCYCFRLAKNPLKCKCLGNFFCAGATPCTNNADCKAVLGKGSKCTAATCCGGTLVCAPKCGTGIAASAQSGATAAGS